MIYNGSFIEVYPLNFSYTPVYWNSEYWLFQKGERGTVDLYIYNGTLKHIKTFKNGSLCVDNDLEIKWNGKEYFLTFMGASPQDNPNTGECILRFKHYLLKDENLIPVDVFGISYWIPPLNAWLVGKSLVNENGNTAYLNIVNASLYSEGVAYNNTHVWLIIAWNSDTYTNVMIYRLNRFAPVKVYSARVNGNVYPPEIWEGNPILIQRTTTSKGSNISVLSFNRSTLLKIHTWDECSMLYPVSVGGRIFTLCLSKSKAKSASNRLELFEIKTKGAELLNTFKTQGYVHVYDVDDFRGFPAFKLWKYSSLIIYTNESIFLFNSIHVLNLLTNEGIGLPGGLKDMEYYVAYCCNGWILFTKNEAYNLKNGKFENLTPEIVTFLENASLDNSNESVKLPSTLENTENGNTLFPISKTLAVIIIGITALIVLILLRDHR